MKVDRVLVEMTGEEYDSFREFLGGGYVRKEDVTVEWFVDNALVEADPPDYASYKRYRVRGRNSFVLVSDEIGGGGDEDAQPERRVNTDKEKTK